MRAIAGASFAFFASAAPAAAQPGGDWGGYGPWHMWGWGMMGTGMGIIMILFWVAILVLAIAAARWLLAAAPGRPTGEAAEDILKKRYARGEIQKEEYEAKLRDLRN
ncbi:MAG: SHOCT domain-containing protein [Candidatus Tectomicrobia bacterium]|uniref:SHOCT domain-containing protein n=1 Tax=Tectimicrobiota bacterium TaxID=2528274 RepID=A0A932HXT8_UNCTE|nr:SHOCT domain-containing protein [Candidatus Tectomicrobia bacterium]